MAEILVKNKATNGGPSDYQLDDIVMIAEDGHQWGVRELSKAFRIISVPGPRADYEQYIEPEPGNLRSVYPRSMIAMHKTTQAMLEEVRQAPIKKQRSYYIGPGNTITRKPIED